MVNLIYNFFRTSFLPFLVNETLITLILKCLNVTSANHLRPISLCNVNYKIISKLLTLRISPLLSKILAPNQSVFLPGRWIGKNLVLVQEIVHTFKCKKRRGGLMAIKVDKQKAYNRVEW